MTPEAQSQHQNGAHCGLTTGQPRDSGDKAHRGLPRLPAPCAGHSALRAGLLHACPSRALRSPGPNVRPTTAQEGQTPSVAPSAPDPAAPWAVMSEEALRVGCTRLARRGGQPLPPAGRADAQPGRGRPGAARVLLQPALPPGRPLREPHPRPGAALPLVGPPACARLSTSGLLPRAPPSLTPPCRYDSLTGIPAQQQALAFEKGSVLFNIGALHTQIGARQDRICPGGASRAAEAFQRAAGEADARVCASQSQGG